jgi:hypothetical protein
MTTPPGLRLRVVVDTNVLIPLLTNPDTETHWLVEFWTCRRIIPLVSSETIEELREKLIEWSPTPKPYQADRFLRKTIRPL